jgi:chemotaxis signal transduction protein
LLHAQEDPMEDTEDLDNELLTAKLNELREGFDAHFAEAPVAKLEEGREVLLVRLGDEPYAVMLADCRGLLMDRRVVHVPSDEASFLGIVGHQGGMLAVYDMAALVQGSGSSAGRWLLVGRSEELAFAVDDFQGRLRVPRDAVRGGTPGSQQRSTVRVGERWYQLVELELLTAELRRRFGGSERRRQT